MLCGFQTIWLFNQGFKWHFSTFLVIKKWNISEQSFQERHYPKNDAVPLVCRSVLCNYITVFCQYLHGGDQEFKNCSLSTCLSVCALSGQQTEQRVTVRSDPCTVQSEASAVAASTKCTVSGCFSVNCCNHHNSVVFHYTLQFRLSNVTTNLSSDQRFWELRQPRGQNPNQTTPPIQALCYDLKDKIIKSWSGKIIKNKLPRSCLVHDHDLYLFTTVSCEWQAQRRLWRLCLSLLWAPDTFIRTFQGHWTTGLSPLPRFLLPDGGCYVLPQLSGPECDWFTIRGTFANCKSGSPENQQTNILLSKWLLLLGDHLKDALLWSVVLPKIRG